MTQDDIEAAARRFVGEYAVNEDWDAAMRLAFVAGVLFAAKDMQSRIEAEAAIFKAKL